MTNALTRRTIDNATQEVFISFSAEVNSSTAETLLAVAFQQITQGARIIHLLMSTPGGDVMPGINLYNVLSALPVHLITHNAGNVDSIGNAIFLSGKERYCCRHSTFMFHGVGFNLNGALRLEEKLLRERLEGIDSDQRRIGSIIREHTALDQATVAEMFREQRTKGADEALTAGIVHAIKEINIPSGHPMIQLVFQR